MIGDKVKFCDMVVTAGWGRRGSGEGAEMNKELDKC